MSYPLTQLGSGAFNHHSSADAEQEYDRLRGLARQEAGKRSSCMDKSHQAYTRGDGAAASSLSSEGHRHADLMNQYNAQASAYIFRENNSLDRVPADTIDLHGQFVDEAERILEQRIRTARAEGATHLHVIVGKGNHSPGHVQKIKPKVEEICREEGLRFRTEENAGRIFVELRPGAGGAGGGGGGGVGMGVNVGEENNFGYPAGYGGRPGVGFGYGDHGNSHHGGGGGQHGQQHYGGGGGQHGYHQQQQQQQDPNAELEAEVKKALPGILRRLRRACCVVM